MSLYRTPGQAKRARWMMIGGAVAAVIIVIVVIVLVAGGGGPKSKADRIADAKTAAQTALDGLELVEVEYGQAIKDGKVAAPTEYGAAQSDVQRAQKALTDHLKDFEAASPGLQPRALTALKKVQAVVDEKGPAADLKATVDEASALLKPLGQ